MEAKLRQLMKHEGINSTRLAEILGIQASGISHIMSGRNKPSFDFIHKLLQRFPQINPDWLLLDKGPMYRDEIKNKGGQPFPSHTSTHTSMGTNTGATATAANQAATGNRTTGDAGLSYNRVGMGTSPSGGTGGDQSVTGGGIIGQTPSGGLFGPDNNDIIPSGTSQPTHPQTTQQQPASFAPPLQSSRQAISQDMQSSGYQQNGFRRSASIERIVVFYKDKTFSEYQPE